MRRVGLSLTHDYLNYDFFKQMAASGVTDVEISDHCEFQDGLIPEKIMADAKNAGVRIWSFHLPFSPGDFVNVCFLDESKLICPMSVSCSDDIRCQHETPI